MLRKANYIRSQLKSSNNLNLKPPKSIVLLEKKRILMKGLARVLFSTTFLYSILLSSASLETIAPNQPFRDGDTIVSPGEVFTLGFFSPGNSQNRYIGIWYSKISTRTVVWVANRETPVNNTSGVLTLSNEGALVLRNATEGVIWSSNRLGPVKNPVARLLDTGNLVITEDGDGNPESFIWQSFDYPGDTLLPGMKLGKDFVTGIERHLTSWKNVNDPSNGENTLRITFDGYPQITQWKGSVIQNRQGPWNGRSWSGLIRSNSIVSIGFVFNEREMYTFYELLNTSVVSRLIITADGNCDRMNWIDRTRGWFLYSTPNADACDRYGVCGAYGSCNINYSPMCACLKGFEPRRPDQWNMEDWSSRCQRSKALYCGNRDGFRKYSGLKLPDSRHVWYNQSMNLKECEMECLSNCSCTAYSNLDIRNGGSGCLLWFGDLIDVKEFLDGGQDFYIRVAISEIEKNGNPHLSRTAKIIVIAVVVAVTIVMGIWLLQAFRKRQASKANLTQDCRPDCHRECQNKHLELPLLGLSTLLVATDNFSIDQKLGEGGFGSVYKGKLLTGQEIAVKRLSKNSGQGFQEFKNEILLISKLQHRNLVRIMGCCLEGEERMLVYEYWPNGSLDNYIFDKDRRALLTWEQRFNIALGIAKGLTYLHYDSRLRVIHRDLKASNVLLDDELNPKISDFGIARIFGKDQSEGKTKRVIGTYGYMSPEYTIHGTFSVKSDVYSFGVLLIEILSGKKNTKYQSPHDHLTLLGHAWLLWNEGRALDLVGESIHDLRVKSQILRFVQIGLLCVQKFPKDRPTISLVVQMLSDEAVKLTRPKQPGFFEEMNSVGKFLPVDEECCSTENVVTVTMLEGR